MLFIKPVFKTSLLFAKEQYAVHKVTSLIVPCSLRAFWGRFLTLVTPGEEVWKAKSYIGWSGSWDWIPRQPKLNVLPQIALKFFAESLTQIH